MKVWICHTRYSMGVYLTFILLYGLIMGAFLYSPIYTFATFYTHKTECFVGSTIVDDNSTYPFQRILIHVVNSRNEPICATYCRHVVHVNVTESGTNATESGTNATESGTNVTESGTSSQCPISGSIGTCWYTEDQPLCFNDIKHQDVVTALSILACWYATTLLGICLFRCCCSYEPRIRDAIAVYEKLLDDEYTSSSLYTCSMPHELNLIVQEYLDLPQIYQSPLRICSLTEWLTSPFQFNSSRSHLCFYDDLTLVCNYHVGCVLSDVAK
jgi:hypothetical protein